MVLILTRRVGETVVIGNEVFCTLLENDRQGALRIAFDAPKKILINRYEIHNRIMSHIKSGNYETNLNWNETVIDRLGADYVFDNARQA